MWTDYYDYQESVVKANVEQKAGVYRMATIEADQKYYPFYVGQAQDLKARLLQHLSASEQNTCIKTRLARNRCYFRFAYVSTQAERDSEEQAAISQFNPDCNKQQSV